MRAQFEGPAAVAMAAVADGMWAVDLRPVGRAIGAGYLGAFPSAEAAKVAAEQCRAGGRGASISRPYCGHWWDDRLAKADSPCQPCAKAKR